LEALAVSGTDLDRKRVERKEPIIVRPARPVDVHYIRSLSRKVFRQYGAYENLLVQWFASGITITLVASMAGQPVGFVMLNRLQGDRHHAGVSELLAIAVEPIKWRMGIGDLLMAEIQRSAIAFSVRILVLHTDVENLPGKHLFQKHGFIPSDVKKAFYPGSQDALMMYKYIDEDYTEPSFGKSG
jgi:ribosomal protein S18 acetylase RimI-like enzyme